MKGDFVTRGRSIKACVATRFAKLENGVAKGQSDMPRLKTLPPRMKQSEGRPFAAPIADGGADGWGSGRGGRPWRRKRAAILVRDEYTCQACGIITLKLEVDHIVNRARGGLDDEENLQALCIPCHKLKTAAEAAAGAARA